MAVWITLPDAVMHVIRILNDAGFEAFVVGGCVRDSLLGNSPTDWDITTSAMPSEMQSIFSEYRTIETGIKHGTLTVLVKDMSLEITTYRIDGAYSDGRHPDAVSFTRSLNEDLRRRDFTVNAMAYHPSVGVVDLYDGQSDLKQGIIRCVGDAECRFKEDALRILRALRFASVHGFTIEKETDTALRHLSPTLNRVAAERIAVELSKLLCGRNAEHIVATYTDVLSVVLPEIRNLSQARLLSTTPAKTYVRLTALFLSADVSPDNAEVALRRLRMDANTIGCTKTLLQCTGLPMYRDADLLRLLNRLDEGLIWDYLALCEANDHVIQSVVRLLENGACYKISMLSVNGNDMMNVGVSMGPDVGSALQLLIDAVIEGRCENRKDDLLRYYKLIKKPAQ